MKKRFSRIKIVLTSFTLVIDIAFFLCINDFFFRSNLKSNHFFNLVFWIIPLLFIISFLGLKFDQKTRQTRILTKIYRLSGLFFTLYLPKIIFIIFHLVNYIFSLIYNGAISLINLITENDVAINEIRIFSSLGIIVAGIVFFLLIYGMTIGRFQYKIEKVMLRFNHLPVSFNRFRIVHISDIHLGSWYRKEEQMKKVVNIINNLEPDLIFFTGDLVNNFSEEANGWTEIIKKFKAKYGKYSILGNHDYGDYWDWQDEQEKSENMKLLLKTHEAIGFRLLLNQADTIAINGHKIGIIGVENWGKPPFLQYGDLKKATGNLKPVPFKILLTHDPSHWSAEVQNKTDIDLTLSGHTHGMQFGFKIGKFQWSPVKYIYKLWSGLYGENGQYLYVNRGLGSLGFPGRVGMRPEITLITLNNELSDMNRAK